MRFYCREVESTRNSKLWRLSQSFQTLIWRPGDTVQNLESPGLSGRVDSPDVIHVNILRYLLKKDARKPVHTQHLKYAIGHFEVEQGTGLSYNFSPIYKLTPLHKRPL